MITARQIRNCVGKSPDYEKTQRLKAELRKLRESRQSFFLDKNDFDKIVRWKLEHQESRVHHLLLDNMGELIQDITRLALNITHNKEDYELELRIGLLRVLRGVGIGIASAILALVYPEQYTVIDYRGWRQVFEPKQTAIKIEFSLKDYKKYLQKIREFARELDLPVQEVDLAI